MQLKAWPVVAQPNNNRVQEVGTLTRTPRALWIDPEQLMLVQVFVGFGTRISLRVTTGRLPGPRYSPPEGPSS